MNLFAKPNNWGMMLLAVWLIVFGILTAPFLKLNFAHSADFLAVLAIVAGVLLFMKRYEGPRISTSTATCFALTEPDA